jgi:hypothetical protein
MNGSFQDRGRHRWMTAVGASLPDRSRPVQAIPPIQWTIHLPIDRYPVLHASLPHLELFRAAKIDRRNRDEH